MGRIYRVGCYCLETGASMAENWRRHGVIAVSLELASGAVESQESRNSCGAPYSQVTHRRARDSRK